MTLPAIQKPTWYEHTLRNERGEVVSTILADHDGPAFGRPDVDYDKLFSVVVVPLYYPGEVERLRAELGEAKGEYDRSANKVASLSAQVDTLTEWHANSLNQLAEAQALLRDIASSYWKLAVELPADLLARLQALSASAEPANDLCAEGAHEFVPFQSNCVKCSEPYQAAPVPKVTPAALREAMENLAVRASVVRPVPVYMSAPALIGPLVILGKVCLRVHYKGLKWYHEQLINDCWEQLAVDEFDELLTEALAKS